MIDDGDEVFHEDDWQQEKSDSAMVVHWWRHFINLFASEQMVD
jgi:hypothetical protein